MQAQGDPWLAAKRSDSYNRDSCFEVSSRNGSSPQHSTTPSKDVGMGQFNKHILQCAAPPTEFAYGPMTFDGYPKNFFAYIRARFHSHREPLPLVLIVSDHISNARNFL